MKLESLPWRGKEKKKEDTVYRPIELNKWQNEFDGTLSKILTVPTFYITLIRTNLLYLLIKLQKLSNIFYLRTSIADNNFIIFGVENKT